MYYAHPLISYPSSSEMGISESTVSKSPSPQKKRYNCNPVLLIVLLSLYGLLHLAVLVLALFLIQSQESKVIIEQLELSVFGFLGFLTSSLAIFGILFKYRYCLTPLLIFLFFAIIIDSISVFATLTASDPDSTILTRYFPLISRTEVVIAVACKALLSSIMLERIVYNFRRNLKIRGGRSPVRRNSPSAPSKDSMDPNQLFVDVELGRLQC